MITLRQLEVLVEVVRAGSFRQCGVHLGMSAVAVSDHIRALEAALGVSLFHRRSGATPQLTDRGRWVYDHAVPILSDLADLQRGAAGGVVAGRRCLTVAVHSFLMRNLYDQAGAFSADHQEINLRFDLTEYSLAEIIAHVANGELDLAYCFALTNEDLPGSRIISRERLGIFVGPAHRFVREAAVTLDELLQEPNVQLTPDNPLGVLVDRALASIGAKDRKIGVETDNFGLIVTSVLRNRGYVCLFEDSGGEQEGAFGLVKVNTVFALPPLQVRCLARRTAQADPILRELMQRIERLMTSAS